MVDVVPEAAATQRVEETKSHNMRAKLARLFIHHHRVSHGTAGEGPALAVQPLKLVLFPFDVNFRNLSCSISILGALLMG